MPRIKFTDQEINGMCRSVCIDRHALFRVLTTLGPPVHLDDPNAIAIWKRRMNRKGIPTYGYCHRVTEAVFRMHKVPAGFQVHSVATPIGSHWFFLRKGAQVKRGEALKRDDIIDLTADQFDQGCDYSGSHQRSLPNVSTIAQMIIKGLNEKEGISAAKRYDSGQKKNGS